MELNEKIAKHYSVKSTNGFEIKVDEEERNVKGIANTYFWVDEDLDMLITGCALKTIKDKGPDSKAVGKIKHQADHSLRTSDSVGKFTVLDERVMNGKTVLYFESKIPKSVKGDEHLANYKEGVYDNHSIGFRYRKIEYAKRDSDVAKERNLWNEFYPLALNPKKVDESGYFFVVKEIELFEISVVSFGSNSLTPNLTGKGQDFIKNIKAEINERLESLNEQLKVNVEGEELKTIDLEFLQLKQIIKDLELKEPLKIDTPQEPLTTNTQENEEPETKTNLLTNIIKNL
jgi:phage head maturation protease